MELGFSNYKNGKLSISLIEPIEIKDDKISTLEIYCDKSEIPKVHSKLTSNNEEANMNYALSIIAQMKLKKEMENNNVVKKDEISTDDSGYTTISAEGVATVEEQVPVEVKDSEYKLYLFVTCREDPMNKVWGDSTFSKKKKKQYESEMKGFYKFFTIMVVAKNLTEAKKLVHFKKGMDEDIKEAKKISLSYKHDKPMFILVDNIDNYNILTIK